MRTYDQLMASAVILSTGVLVFCVCTPLILRKVPMNRFYGIRIREAFESDQRWYDINAEGGKILARWSILMILAGAAGFFVPAGAFVTYMLAVLAVAIVSMFLVLISITRWARTNR